MTPAARFSDYLARLPSDRPVVIDLDDGDVDAILVPGDVVARVVHAYEPAEHDAIYRVIALLIARLGSDTAVPVVRRWIDAEPAFLRDFPAETLRQLATDPEAIGPLLGRLNT